MSGRAKPGRRSTDRIRDVSVAGALGARSRMGYEPITTDLAEGLMTITLNRPDRLNAWTAAMQRELIAAINGPAVGVGLTMTWR